MIELFERIPDEMLPTIIVFSNSIVSAASPAALGDLQNFEGYAELIFSILTKVFIITLVTIAIVYILRVLTDRRYSIRHVHVPGSFEELGHSGPVIANRIFYRIQQIIQRVSATEFVKGYSTSTAEADVSVDVGGMGLPIKGFVELLGGALGIQGSKKVDADFFIEHNNLVMIIKISGHEADRFEVSIGDSVDQALKILIFEAAEVILKYSNDEILQTYFGLIEQVGEKQIKLAKYRLDKYRNNPKIEINAIAALAWGFCMQKKYDDAEQVIKAGIAHHKKAGRIYVIWGSLLNQLGKHEEALEKLKLALDQATKNETKTRISNIYSNMGSSYLKLNQKEMAIKFLKQAISIEPRMSRPYYNLALMHLTLNEVDHFFEELEKAFERGFSVQNMVKDPKCEPLLQDQRMKRLIERYSE